MHLPIDDEARSPSSVDLLFFVAYYYLSPLQHHFIEEDRSSQTIKYYYKGTPGIPTCSKVASASLKSQSTVEPTKVFARAT